MSDPQTRVEQPSPNSPKASPGVLFLSAVLGLLLIDAAVETFLAGAPVRWIVAGTVAAYLTLTLLLRRKLTLAASAWAALFVLLGLLAFTAWRPEGMAAGVVILRQPTSSVLAAVTTLAILLAGWILVRLRFLPMAARAVAGLLALYGVAGMISGIVGGTPYPALFQGESIWTQLPFWLQGAFTGGLVVLPSGLVVQTIKGGLRSWRRSDPEPWGLHQAVALALSLVMTVSGVLTMPPSSGQATASTSRPGEASAAGQVPPYVPPGPPVSVDAPLEGPTTAPVIGPEALAAKAEAAIREIRPERYDVEALARSLGPGVEPAFAFVRDRVHYEAYPGVLRGVEGTFVTRAGNAPDRSLLLAKLLELKSVPVRYAIGRLARADAERLYDHIFDAPAASTGGSAPQDAMSSDAGRFWARVTTRARRDYQAIRTAVSDSLRASPQPTLEDVLSEIGRHVWLQANDGGRWVDLDSSFGDATVGRAYARLEQTVGELPAELQQRVTVRVKIETLDEGRLQTSTALEKTMPAEALLGRQVFLFHVRASAGGGLGIGFGAGSQGGDAWVPTLVVDDESHAGTAIEFGDAAVTDVGSELAGGGGTSGPMFVAEWLEFDMAFPGGRRDVTRRALVDRAGALWRHDVPPRPDALAPVQRNERGPVTVQSLHNIWFTAGRHDLVTYAKSVSLLARALSPDASDDSPEVSLDDVPLRAFALQNLALPIWSDHAVLSVLNDSTAYRFYADSPRVMIFTAAVNPETAGRGLYSQIDLHRDRLRGLARKSSSVQGVADRRVWFGALEGALEHELAVEESRAVGGDGSEVTSTSSLLTPEGALLVADADGARAERLATDPEVAARIGQALGRRAVLVVPRGALRSGHTGWWEIRRDGADTTPVLDYALNGVYRGYGMPGQVTPKAYYEALARMGPRRKPAGNEYTIVITIPQVVMDLVWLMGVYVAAGAVGSAALILAGKGIGLIFDSLP